MFIVSIRQVELTDLYIRIAIYSVVMFEREQLKLCVRKTKHLTHCRYGNTNSNT
jgi:hypothetical protein